MPTRSAALRDGALRERGLDRGESPAPTRSAALRALSLGSRPAASRTAPHGPDRLEGRRHPSAEDRLRGLIRPPTASRLATLALLALASACAGSGPGLPQPRPVVIFSGERLHADYEEMLEVHDWFVRSQNNIQDDPTFLVITSPIADEAYPWTGHRLEGDTAWAFYDPRAPFTQSVQMAYAHLHLMDHQERLDEWLPEAVGLEGYALERAIIARCSRAWLLARTVFAAEPYGPLDELVYADEAEHLDAFIFTARPSEFAIERAEWARANPEATAEYREWFLGTFNREPPGLRSN